MLDVFSRLALHPELDEQARDGRVARVEELAARLDRETRHVVGRDSASETGPRLDDRGVHTASGQGDGRRDARHAATDDQDIVPVRRHRCLRYVAIGVLTAPVGLASMTLDVLT
jgi:hypothetical protein